MSLSCCMHSCAAMPAIMDVVRANLHAQLCCNACYNGCRACKFAYMFASLFASFCRQEKEVGYQLREKVVQPYEDASEMKSVKAVVFCSSPLLVLRNGVDPPFQYLAKLQQGAQEKALNVEYCAWLLSIAPASSTDLLRDEYNATLADLLAKVIGALLLFGISWASVR